MADPNIAFNRFKYIRSSYRRSDDCNICYGGDCMNLDQARCEYYAEADSVLPRDGEEPEGFQNPQLRSDVNSILYDILEKVEQSPDMECIPYISRYTDCTKENVCLGCRTCHCIEAGRWNCSSTSHCHAPDPAVDVDHRVIIMTIENVAANIKMNRQKRSVTVNPFEKINGSTLTLKELSEWIYGMAPENKDDPNDDVNNSKQSNKQELNIAHASNEQSNPMLQINIVAEPVTSDVESTPKTTTLDMTNDFTRFTTETAIKPHSEHVNFVTLPVVPNIVDTDQDYLAFDEVLSNIAIDSKNYSRRKPLLDILPNPDLYNKTADFDYMLLDEDKTTEIVNIDNVTEMSYIVNFAQRNEVTEPTFLDESTKVVIDLLESAKKDPLFNGTDYIDMSPNKEDLVGVGFDNTNDIYEDNPMNIMKREVSSVTEVTKSSNVTNEKNLNITNTTDIENKATNHESKYNLKNNVLLPLIKLINSKRDELEDLKKIKQNLISFMNYYNQSPVVEIIDYPNISDTNILHDIEMFPDLGYDLRRTNPNVMKKFLYKLKTDIYEVIKDIIGLERYKQGRLPDDLSLLIHSLKRYVGRSKSHKKHIKIQHNHHQPFVNYRRHLNFNTYKCLESTFKHCVIEIFQAVDRDMPKTNALGSLSMPVKRILRNIIRTFNTDDYTLIGLRVHDPNYNITNDLETIGSEWQDVSVNAIGRSPQVTMYKMKRLHYFLEKDISKINDALILILFAQHRRLTSNFKNINSNVVDDINKGLNSVHNNVEVIVQYHANNPKQHIGTEMGFNFRSNEDVSLTTPVVIKEVLSNHKTKKISFIKQIRNLLKSSKRDIGELLHRQVPKSDIVKQLAKQKLNELAQQRYDEYESAMKKWQKNLGVVPRYKRNTPDQLSDRIKNIIPRYLRSKVHPLRNDKNSTHKKKGKSKKKHGSKKNKRTTLTTATTPRTKTTTKSRTTKAPHKSTGTTPKIKAPRRMKQHK